jgi:hypothetical protein
MEDDKEWCDLLKVQAVPLLFTAENPRLMCPIEGISTVGFTIYSQKLENQINALKNIQGCGCVEYKSIYYIGRFLENTSKYRKLILMPQPYTFYNVKENKDRHFVSLKYAIYSIDNKIGTDSFKEVNENIKINPEDIMNTEVYTELKCTDKSLHIKAEFEVCSFLPIQIFYTLLLIPYNGGFPRILVCRNILTIDDKSNFGQSLSELSYCNYAMKLIKFGQVKEQLDMIIKGNERFRDDMIDRLIRVVAGTFSQEKLNFLMDLMYYYIWKNSGSPNENDYGSNNYKRLIGENSKGIKGSNEFLSKCISSVLDEISEWVNKIN